MLYIMRGTSCSGKDRYCDEFFEDNQVLSSDKFRIMIVGSVNCQKYNKRVFELMHEMVKCRIENRVPVTVVNATHLSIKDIRYYLDLQKVWEFPIKVISLEPPSLLALISRRNKRLHGSQTLDVVLERHIQRYYDCMGAFKQEDAHNELFTFCQLEQEHEL